MKWFFREFEMLSGSEVYEMLRLRMNVFIVEQNCAYAEADGNDNEAIHLFCNENDELVAYARLLPAGVKYAEPSIGRVIVREDFRGQGIAHTIMQKSIQYVEDKWKSEKIRLQAQVHLTSFYAQHGFKPISEPYDDDGIPHVDMILYVDGN